MIKHLLAIALALAGAASAAAAAPLQPAARPLPTPQRAIPAEVNPPGDIPDDQAFVTYASPLGFSISVPEGWARLDGADFVAFSDKYNEVRIALSQRPAAPTVAGLQTDELAALRVAPKAIRIADVKKASLPAGAAVVVGYGSNSDPNPVTNKAIRLDNARYFFWKAGKLAVLTLSAPAGADNVDQWRQMARSFAWR